MITCSLKGGLGNMMFQIAFTHAMSKKNNVEYGIDFNVHYLPLQGRKAEEYRNNIFSRIPGIPDGVKLKRSVTESGPWFEEVGFKDEAKYIGFWQSWKYFVGFEDEIKNIFCIPEPTIGGRVSDMTSIHVRRGDYLAHPWLYNLLTVDYYQKAMDLIGGYFMVFSDDMDWCRNNLVGDNIYYSSGSSDIEDMSIMKHCKNNIIAPSSFSWWAAYLNPNPDKKIISPKYWYNQESGRHEADIRPDNWIKI